MITIDGKFGEGGGQILRTSLALSMITGKPFRIVDIRAGRKKPGLLRQHLTAVKAARQVTNARMTGVSTGSGDLTFEPRDIQAGNYHFAVGTAGAATLVLQTILPALAIADAPSEVVLEGGTHNPYAPPFDFLAEAFLPIVKRMGWQVELDIDRWGFFPAGGGRFTARIQPAKETKPLALMERGDVTPSVLAISANIPAAIRYDEAQAVAEHFGWDSREGVETLDVNSPGPGNALMVKLRGTGVTEVFTGFGERGVGRKKVVKNTVDLVRRYLEADDVPVGRFLADQLMIPCAMAGKGQFRTLEPTQHSRTNAAVIQEFLAVNIEFSEKAKDDWLVTVRQ